ncbi:hypothetical protein KIPB_009520 [Kipferlia bialata]|uniref:Uncharacterized protein n=1 Tax=Kipferlia bialata TaxID=797122 RepID=A0A9K3D4E4_9EUKA|nr:hypothetical protein KIPB_009520 [Kipferlia bialata]|eukprot:g9520.t1
MARQKSRPPSAHEEKGGQPLHLCTLRVKATLTALPTAPEAGGGCQMYVVPIVWIPGQASPSVLSTVVLERPSFNGPAGTLVGRSGRVDPSDTLARDMALVAALEDSDSSDDSDGYTEAGGRSLDVSDVSAGGTREAPSGEAVVDVQLKVTEELVETLAREEARLHLLVVRPPKEQSEEGTEGDGGEGTEAERILSAVSAAAEGAVREMQGGKGQGGLDLHEVDMSPLLASLRVGDSFVMSGKVGDVADGAGAQGGKAKQDKTRAKSRLGAEDVAVDTDCPFRLRVDVDVCIMKAETEGEEEGGDTTLVPVLPTAFLPQYLASRLNPMVIELMGIHNVPMFSVDPGSV